jgi:glycosyltransferase involved in cell wall biosynthesis
VTVLLAGNFLSASVGNRGVCEDLADRLRDAGWNVLTTSRRRGRVPRLADMLATVWQRRREYDVANVDVYSGPSFFWAEAVAWTLERLGKPYSLTLHGGALPEFAALWPGRVRRLLEGASAVTAPSGFLLENLRPYRPDLRLIPNALDLARYPFRHRAAPDPRLVWVRAFHEIYDPSLAVRVLKEIRARHPEATLEMIGPDKHDGSFARARAVAGQLGVTSAVEFAGAVPKSRVPERMNSGDIFLNTTTIDNTPVSVMEAMACGACVVSTNVGGIPHLVKSGEDGLLVPPRNPGAMAAAVERLFSEDGLAARISLAARAKTERFDWGVVLPQWEEMLRGVASRNPDAAKSPGPGGYPARTSAVATYHETRDIV